ncbi:MAG TPA: hypothetical protein ENN72_04130 [Firmicutes bacterium]|nr:hypothetical protein [Bacillota bacterium]
MRYIVCLFILFTFSCQKRVEHPHQIHSTEPQKAYDDVAEVTYKNIDIPFWYAGSNGDAIYFAGPVGEKWRITFSDTNLKEERFIEIGYGKGPGEIATFSALHITDDLISIYDDMMQRVSLFSLSGDFIDVANLPTLPITVSFQQVDGAYLFHPFEGSLLVSFSKDGTLLAEKVYNSARREIRHQDPYLGGCMISDGEYLYFGYANSPFRVEKFDSRLNSLKVITRPFKAFKGKVNYYRKKDIFVTEGRHLIWDLLVNDSFIVASVGRGRVVDETKIHSEDSIWKNITVENEIDIFDKETGKWLIQIKSPQIPSSSSGYQILGFDGNKLLLLTHGLELNGKKGTYIVRVLIE